MSQKAFRHLPLMLICGLVSLTAIPLMAGVEGGTANVEVYLGSYQPDSPYDADLSFGIRGGGSFTDHFGLQGIVGYFSSHSGCCLYGVDYSNLFTELSAIWYANPDHLAVLMIYGGSGLNFADLDAATVGDDALGVTFHGGVGLNVALSDLVYVRPDARLRWISKGIEYDRVNDLERVGSGSMTDYEISLSIGFTIGR